MAMEPAPVKDDIFPAKGVMAPSWLKWFGKLFDLLNVTVTVYEGPTVQSDVTASRVLGTVYQNTTGKPMWVRVMGIADSAAGNLFFYTDAANPPTALVDKTVMY